MTWFLINFASPQTCNMQYYCASDFLKTYVRILWTPITYINNTFLSGEFLARYGDKCI